MPSTSLPRHLARPTDETLKQERDALIIKRLKERHDIRTVRDLGRAADELGISPSELLASVA
ncbi:hypothetical protein CQ018_19675 [Arthrobacter sp. MYb227]|uniref:hypothetical protein n=1 Tax=Arthrobacter sp. MYb227 TaxID=1848601 RepID=UPI000CFBDD8C|nr:hypothetical protein [Arthrobacter sp. MYb227]PQZ85599.1 hypothetical protein CQ018_19675 [Arthrobacter sp. MYb227]